MITAEKNFGVEITLPCHKSISIYQNIAILKHAMSRCNILTNTFKTWGYKWLEKMNKCLLDFYIVSLNVEN